MISTHPGDLPHAVRDSFMAPALKRGALAVFAALSTATSLGSCAVGPPDLAHASASVSPPSQASAQSPGIAAPTPMLPHGRHVPTRVGRLAVRDTGPTAGTGEVIVMWPSILSDHRIYRSQIEAWRGHHRLVVIDGPGHGESGPAPGLFTMASCGEALGEVLDALGIERPVVVVGTSWGGLVAGEFALAYPGRTRAVVMLNTPVHRLPGGPGFGDRFVVWGARWIPATRLYRDGVARAFFLPATRERGGPMLEDFHEHLRGADGAALALSVRSVLIERAALAPRLADIDAPTLFLVGRYDGMYPPDSLRSAAETLPRGRFEVLDTSHISVMDAPAQTTALIDGFLAGLEPAPR
jgi:3-oxoadipate enol-lactonase